LGAELAFSPAWRFLDCSWPWDCGLAAAGAGLGRKGRTRHKNDLPCHDAGSARHACFFDRTIRKSLLLHRAAFPRPNRLSALVTAIALGAWIAVGSRHDLHGHNR